MANMLMEGLKSQAVNRTAGRNPQMLGAMPKQKQLNKWAQKGLGTAAPAFPGAPSPDAARNQVSSGGAGVGSMFDGGGKQGGRGLLSHLSRREKKDLGKKGRRKMRRQIRKDQRRLEKDANTMGIGDGDRVNDLGRYVRGGGRGKSLEKFMPTAAPMPRGLEDYDRGPLGSSGGGGGDQGGGSPTPAFNELEQQLQDLINYQQNMHAGQPGYERKTRDIGGVEQDVWEPIDYDSAEWTRKLR